MRDTFFPYGWTVAQLLSVDPANGNDATGSKGGLPFRTIAAANAAAVAGDVILLTSGIHTVTATIVITPGVKIVGLGQGVSNVSFTYNGNPAGDNRPCFQLSTQCALAHMTIYTGHHLGAEVWASCVGVHRNVADVPTTDFLLADLNCRGDYECFYVQAHNGYSGRAVNCTFRGQRNCVDIKEGPHVIDFVGCTFINDGDSLGGLVSGGIKTAISDAAAVSTISLYACDIQMNPILAHTCYGLVHNGGGPGAVPTMRLSNCTFTHGGAGTNRDVNLQVAGILRMENTPFQTAAAEIVGDASGLLTVKNFKPNVVAADMAALVDGVGGHLVQEGWIVHQTDHGGGAHDVISDGALNWPDVPW